MTEADILTDEQIKQRSSAGALSGMATGAQKGFQYGGVFGAAAGAIGGLAVGFGTSNVAAYEERNQQRQQWRESIASENLAEQEQLEAQQASKNPWNPANSFNEQTYNQVNNIMDPSTKPFASTAVTNRNEQLRSLGLGTTGDYNTYK